MPHAGIRTIDASDSNVPKILNILKIPNIPSKRITCYPSLPPPV